MMARKVMAGASGVSITSPNHPNLVFYHTMDNVSGSTLIDETTNSNDGTINGATFVAGHIGNAANFDGINDTVAMPSNVVADGGSVGFASFWFFFVSVPSAVIIYSGADTSTSVDWLAFTVRPGNLLAYQRTSDTLTATNTAATSTWHHGVISCDGSVKKIWLNGVQETIIIAAGVNDGEWFSDIANPGSHAAEYGRIPDLTPFLGDAYRLDAFRLFEGIEATQAMVDDLYNGGTGA